MDGLATVTHKYSKVIAEIGALRWRELDATDLTAAAAAYHYFSIQFRENLQLAVSLFPDDSKLRHLLTEESQTSNLSPWPGVAAAGECMDHDEFMRRTLLLAPLPPAVRSVVDTAGAAYLARARAYGPLVRALSIASYENGGLEATFRAMLTALHWNTPALAGFRHFLVRHLHFDTDPEQGHGALSRHLQVDDRVLPLWEDFYSLLVCAVPRLTNADAQYAD